MINMVRVALVISVIIALANQGYFCVEIGSGCRKVRSGSAAYMVSIQLDNKHLCGGTLIHSNWVLTAASCEQLFKRKKPTVVLGEQSTKKKGATEQKILVKKALPFPEFKHSSQENDIMLLQLAQDANIKSKSVEIFQLQVLPKDIKRGTKCSVLRWENTIAKGLKSSITLMEADVTVTDQATCSKSYHKHPIITNNMICATEKKSKNNLCMSSPGGPLLCKIGKMLNKKKILCGIATVRKNSKDANQPEIYTQLTEKYIPWIQKLIGVESYNVSIQQI